MEHFIQQCQALLITAESGLLLSMFVGGLLGSVGHCTGMCGPIVMGQVNAQDHQPELGRLSWLGRSLLLPYHLGRTVTYMLLGVVGASVSQFMVGTPYHSRVAAMLLLVAGALFIFKALPVRGSLKLLTTKLPYVKGAVRGYGRVVSTIAAPFSRRQNRGNLFFFGAALGFLPCGLVMAAVFTVAATGNPLLAAGGMALFSLGTMPVLSAFGLGARVVQRKWPHQVRVVTNYVMALSGFFLCASALRLAL